MSARQKEISTEELKGPFDSLRDYVAFLEQRGRLMRIEEIDQDQYEGTALMYRLGDEFGYDNSPSLLFDRIKIDGRVIEGPVFANPYGPPEIEAAILGVDITDMSQREARRAGIAKALECLDSEGQWKRIKPVEVTPDKAVCKEVVLSEDEINLYDYAWLKNNPADAARYCNVTGVIMDDPEFGKNCSTYRCQIKGERKMAVAPEPGQDGYRILDGMINRGDKVAQVAVALGCDPLTYYPFPSKMAPFGVDEFEVAGGLWGRPIEMVKAETSDLMVPANAEIIIEGEIPLDDFEDEGPYGELFGFIGRPHKDYFYINVKAITQRRKPWICNSFTGFAADAPTILFAANDYHQFKPEIPNLVDINLATNNIGVVVVSIDKQAAGEGMAAGKAVAAGHIVGKVIIVVDKDVDVCNKEEVMRSMGSRWQPANATHIIEEATNPGAWLDPSAPVRGRSSQVVIDATRQYESEGGPKTHQPVCRSIVEERAAAAFELVNRNWEEYLAGWKR